MRHAIAEHRFPSGACLQIAQGDITTEHVDAIVNAANRHLAHGAGVAGAIVRKGGRVVQEESDRWVLEHGLVSNAQPAYTSAGSLPCRYVIHAVGPVWGEGDEDRKLASAIRGSLALADDLCIQSIAFPALSTGVFGFPASRAAKVILETIRAYMDGETHSTLKLIRVILFDTAALQAFLDVWEQYDHFRA
jgi:O-acetyl-ADP-ribose deacetylase (regulator of RNase III)